MLARALRRILYTSHLAADWLVFMLLHVLSALVVLVRVLLGLEPLL